MIRDYIIAPPSQVIVNSDATSLVFHLIRVAPVFNAPLPIDRLPVFIKLEGKTCTAVDCNVFRSPNAREPYTGLASENGIKQISETPAIKLTEEPS
jgi:hypothetical protein